MNCEEVSNHLVDYFDRSLDTATMTRVATHVIACPHCHSETSGLTDVVQQVASLPMVNLPLGFAQRVMAHVREIEPKPSLWQRIFRPLTKSVPLSATAMVMVGGLAVYLFQKQPTPSDNPVNLALRSSNSESPVGAPEPSAQNRTRSNANFTAPANEKKSDALKPSADPATTTAEAAAHLKARAATTKSLERAAVASAALKEEAATALDPAVGDARAAPRRPVIRAQEATAGGQPAPFGAAMSLGVPRAPAPMILEQSRIPLVERIADIEYVVRRRGGQPRQEHAEPLAAASVDGSHKAAEADSNSAPAKRAAPAASPRIQSLAEIRFYNVALEHLELFKKELANEASVETEARITGRDRDASAPPDRQLLIKVTILPAETSTR